MLIFVIIFLLLSPVTLMAEFVSPYGARPISLNEGARSSVSGIDYLAINPASIFSDETTSIGLCAGVGQGYLSSSITYVSENNFGLMIGLTDIDSNREYEALMIKAAYAVDFLNWIVGGVNFAYNSSEFLDGFDISVAFNIGEEAKKRSRGFLSSIVFRNLLKNHGLQEFSFGISYLFPYGLNLSIDDIVINDQEKNRMDIVFASEFIFDENNSVQFSVKFKEISSLLDLSYGFGWTYGDDDFKIALGVNGSDFSRLIYGFMFARNF